MTDAQPRLPWWPFILVDAYFAIVAALLMRFGHRPFLWWEACFLIVCAAGGAWSFLTPVLQRHAQEQGYSQVKLLADAAGQIQKLDQLAAQIGGATAQWLELQGNAAQTAQSAKMVADQMTAEAKAFAEFMKKASETEKTHLRVEVEKLRRTEGEWLQLVAHLLDHVFALFLSAQRSGQPALMEQVSQFRNACCEAARRVGLVPALAREGEAYDPTSHQLPENIPAADNAVIAETLMNGYHFQGKLLRKPLVSVREPT